jgi:glycosyltransferase involved in cell wall biosynthesis
MCGRRSAVAATNSRHVSVRIARPWDGYVLLVVIDVVLPCLDEAPALPWVLSRMPVGFRALVVDNGSTDGSAAIARAAGAHVVGAAQRGYGAACHAGLLAATSDVVCVMDADASLDPRDLPWVARTVVEGSADLVLGRRTTRSLRAWPLPARMANVALATAMRRRTGLPLRDLGPVRAFHREAMIRLELSDRRFGYPLETLLAAHAAGWRITEVPVRYLPRTGRSKVTGTLSGYVRTVRDMLAVLAQ